MGAESFPTFYLHLKLRAYEIEYVTWLVCYDMTIDE